MPRLQHDAAEELPGHVVREKPLAALRACGPVEHTRFASIPSWETINSLLEAQYRSAGGVGSPVMVHLGAHRDRAHSDDWGRPSFDRLVESLGP